MATPTYDAGQGYREVPWPQLRNTVLAVLEQARPHACWGLLEVDITGVLEDLKRCQRELRIAVSLHAVVLRALAVAAAENPGVMTYRHGRRLVTFTEADVGMTLDRRIQGHRIPGLYCVRGAQRKSLAALNWELRAALHPSAPSDPAIRVRRRVARLPGFARGWFNAVVRGNPHWGRRLYGTVALTNLQSPGLTFPFWGLPPTICTLTAAVGGLTDRVMLDAGGRPVSRRVLCLTGAADHAVIDGMALSRFTTAFVETLRARTRLDEGFIEETRELAARDPATRGARPVPVPSVD
jgi:hypothetical protein